jgi:hypothetical protein
MRAERLMHFAETIVERAGADDDYRLQLQAIDRVKSSLELVMRAVGMIGADVSVTVDNRQVNLYQNWQTGSLAALESFHAALESGATVSEACRAVQGQIKAPQALSPGREDKSEAA